jgi:serine/threonine protein kinase
MLQHDTTAVIVEVLQANEVETQLDLFVKEVWNAKRLKKSFFPKAVIPKNRTYRYYVMQHFKGEDLDKYLTHKHISIDDGENIQYKIIDFGSITEIFSTNSKAGTPSFLSPERFLNESINESSEIFAIGVTLYLTLTGKYPYGEIEPFQSHTFKEAKKPSIYNSNIPH